MSFNMLVDALNIFVVMFIVSMLAFALGKTFPTLDPPGTMGILSAFGTASFVVVRWLKEVIKK